MEFENAAKEPRQLGRKALGGRARTGPRPELRGLLEVPAGPWWRRHQRTGVHGLPEVHEEPFGVRGAYVVSWT